MCTHNQFTRLKNSLHRILDLFLFAKKCISAHYTYDVVNLQWRLFSSNYVCTDYPILGENVYYKHPRILKSSTVAFKFVKCFKKLES